MKRELRSKCYKTTVLSRNIDSDTGLQGPRYDVKNKDGVDVKSMVGLKQVSRSRFKGSDVVRWPFAFRTLTLGMRVWDGWPLAALAGGTILGPC